MGLNWGPCLLWKPLYRKMLINLHQCLLPCQAFCRTSRKSVAIWRWYYRYSNACSIYLFFIKDTCCNSNMDQLIWRNLTALRVSPTKAYISDFSRRQKFEFILNLLCLRYSSCKISTPIPVVSQDLKGSQEAHNDLKKSLGHVLSIWCLPWHKVHVALCPVSTCAVDSEQGWLTVPTPPHHHCLAMLLWMRRIMNKSWLTMLVLGTRHLPETSVVSAQAEGGSMAARGGGCWCTVDCPQWCYTNVCEWCQC